MNDNAAEAGASPDGKTMIKRASDTQIVVTRTFDAPARLVFEAWSQPELFRRWWVPKSIGMPLRSCEMDVRTGGTYRLEFGAESGESFAFFGRYTEVVPPNRIVWTNEESPGGAVSTVTLVETDGKTKVTFSETYSSKGALEENLGGMDGTPEQFAQLDELLVEMAAR